MTGKTNLSGCSIIAVFLLGMVSIASGQTIYVDADAIGANDGLSWTNAYNYLQDALTAASSGDEIWVAQGIYKPDHGGSNTPGSRTATFQLKNGVAVKGGYAGFGQLNPDTRDIEVYETALSGDLLGNDGPDFANNDENSYHVVTGSGTDATAVLDGFTINGGNTDGSDWKDGSGGGMVNAGGSPTLTHCTFTGNSSVRDGGGMFNSEQSNPTLTNCTFTGNSTIYDGGAICNRTSSPTVTNCKFNGNSANHGGGISNWPGSPTVTNCTFSRNSAELGGAVFNWNSGPLLANCIFSENSAREWGGAICNLNASSPTLTDCTFSNNSASYGGGMRNNESSPTLTNCTFSNNSAEWGGGMLNNESSPTLTNCTFNDNSAELAGGMFNNYGSPTVTNCTFSDNSAVNGGGMCNVGGSPTLTNCTFIHNQVSGFGGAMLNMGSNPTVTNSTFNDNRAAWGGGMENENNSNLSLIGCTLKANSATMGGGAIRNHTSRPTVLNCLIVGNQAQFGGAIQNENSSSNPTLINCTLSHNSATLWGGGILNHDNSRPILNNCILWANSDNGGLGESAQIYEGLPAVNYCCIQGWTGSFGGIGNIKADPWFVEPGYRLHRGSPCINTGDNSAVPPSLLTDRDGNPRIVCGTVDMGVYEFWGSRIFYVDRDALGANDGSSWVNAFSRLQYALAVAQPCDEIRVAQGIYKPAYSITPPPPPPPPGGSSSEQVILAVIDRTATFQLINGVTIKGGYAGIGEANPNARDIEVYETILSGDLADNDGPNFAGNDENSYHVVTGSECDQTAIIDGFTITAGYANGFGNPDDSGGGMYNTSGSPTLANCTFSGNSGHAGGGMFNKDSRPTLLKCTFSGNSTTDVVFNESGGGMYNDESSPTLTNCTFDRNSAADHGGGMFNYFSSKPTLINCMFIGNVAVRQDGGGMFNGSSSHPTLTNCLFIGNIAKDGGGMRNWGADPTLVNCTFSKNSARGNGGGVSAGVSWSKPKLTNCILWGNSDKDGVDESAQIYYGRPEVNYCCIQGWTGSLGGTGNIDADPRFVQPEYSGPIAYWKLDEAGGTTAYDSVGDNHGILINGPTWTTGQIDGALRFDGVDDYIDIEDDITLEPQNLTVSAWVYRESTFSQHVILQKGSTHSHDDRNGYLFKILDSSNSYPNSASLCVTINNGCNIYPISNTEIQAGIWYHIAATYDGSHARIYVNGVEDGTDISDTGPVDYSGGYQDFKIGAQEEGHGLLWGHFNGNIDEVAIYNRALSAEEIQQHYLSGLNGQGYPDANMPDYHLLPDSPCINTGDPDYIAEPNETDIDGKPRVIAGRIDMGAYEFNHIPVADAGPEKLVECACNTVEGTKITLDGTGSFDTDGDPLTYTWTGPFVESPANGATPTVTLEDGFPGDYVITLIVNDGTEDSEPATLLITVVDTTPPVITCPVDVTLECPTDTSVEANGSATATDNCDDSPEIVFSDLFYGTCTKVIERTWTATDATGNSSSCVQVITVVDTTPPDITCPADVTLEYPADTSVEANGSATAGDTCSSATITHSDAWQPSCGNTGTLTRTWTATDECGNSSTCVQTITVVDTTPPEFSLSVSPSVLWPPTHKMVLITPIWAASDNCDATPEVSLVSISVNEADDAKGAGNTSDDIQVGDDGSIYLRAERSGTGDNRVYTITYRAVDDCGNATVSSATVTVPHDQR